MRELAPKFEIHDLLYFLLLIEGLEWEWILQLTHQQQ